MPSAIACPSVAVMLATHAIVVLYSLPARAPPYHARQRRGLSLRAKHLS